MAQSAVQGPNLKTVFAINQGVVIHMSETAAVFHRTFTTQDKRCQLP